MSDIVISSLRGGMNDTDPPMSLPEDQCTQAENVEFLLSACGERRNGCEVVTITGSGLEDETHMAFLHRHLPTADETIAQLWAFAVTPGASSQLAYKTTTWNPLTPSDAIGIAGVEGFRVSGQTLHGKLFLAYKSAQNRLHVWDGTNLRRVGLLTPTAAPTGANGAVAGTLAGTRYARIRYTVMSGSTVLRRSEPSAVLTFTPSGSFTTYIITKPATISESETHWEIELSVDNSNFYRMAQIVVGTTTHTDAIDFAIGYATTGVLSEDSGDYTVPPSCKFVAVDEDRLIMGGSWETPAQDARVSWTPVLGDTGSGNDERIPIDTNNFLDLDTTEGGEMTALSDTVNGYVYAFKLHHVYQLVRSGQRTKAYQAVTLSTVRGALRGSLVAGIDQTGNPCLYFLDLTVGPCRIGVNGLQTCSLDIQTTWKTVNVDATQVISTGVFYPDSKQVHWCVATEDENVPSLRLVLQTNECRQMDDGVRRGFSTATGLSATGISSCIFSENVNDNTARNMIFRPLIGVSGANASILRLDTGTTDAGTAFYAHITTRPYVIAGILNRFGIKAAAVLAKAASGITLYVKAIRDFGVESLATLSTTLTAAGTETQVIKQFDQLNLSELHAVQIEFGDDPAEVTPSAGTFEINQLAFKTRTEGRG